MDATDTKNILDALTRHGITNKFTQKAILGVTSKESPNHTRELSYRNTSIARIRDVFKDRVAKYTDEELHILKTDDVEFFDTVYGYKCSMGIRYGNTLPGDGLKYVGRGFNGITFKSTYKELQRLYEKGGSKLGHINIVENPDLLNQAEIAAEFLALYYIMGFGKRDINKYTDQNSAILDCVQCNAGWKTSLNSTIGREAITKATAYIKTLTW